MDAALTNNSREAVATVRNCVILQLAGKVVVLLGLLRYGGQDSSSLRVGKPGVQNSFDEMGGATERVWWWEAMILIGLVAQAEGIFVRHNRMHPVSRWMSDRSTGGCRDSRGRQVTYQRSPPLVLQMQIGAEYCLLVTVYPSPEISPNINAGVMLLSSFRTAMGYPHLSQHWLSCRFRSQGL